MIGDIDPADAVHIQPITDGRFFFRLRATAENVAIGIFDLHFVGPRIVCGEVADFGACAAIFFEESVCVAYANPDPGAGVSLIALGEKDGAAAAGHAGKNGRLPFDVEAEFVDVVVDAGSDAFDAEDGSVAFEDGWLYGVLCCGHCGNLRTSGEDDSAILRRPPQKAAATGDSPDSLSLGGSGCYRGVFAESARMAQGLAIVWPCNHLRGILNVLEARS